MKEPKDHKEEVALKYYESARNNIITRLKLRDNSFLLYTGGVSGIFIKGLAANSHHLLLLIPPVSVPVILFILQHNFVMDSLYEYIVNCLSRDLIKTNHTEIPWEASWEYNGGRRFSTLIRFVGEYLSILLASVFGIIFYALKSNSCLLTDKPFIVSIIFLFIIFILVIYAWLKSREHECRLHKYVEEIYSEYHKTWKN